MRAIITTLALAFTSSLAHAETLVEPTTLVSQQIDALHAAAAKADGKAYFDLFTPDAVFIGTDVTERWSIAQFRAYAEPIFAKGKGWTYHLRQRHVSITTDPCGCVAWFDEVLDSESYGTARGSGVLTRTPDGWKISQYVLSFPIPNDIADGITKDIKAYEAGPK